VGRWSLSSSHGIDQSTGVIEFDNEGRYYGGPTGTDLSQTYAYDGAYQAGPTSFTLVFSCGDGCAGGGAFSLQFQNGCAIALLNEMITDCTGNRIVVAGDVVLTRQ
jgi:hypothetical protein